MNKRPERTDDPRGWKFINEDETCSSRLYKYRHKATKISMIIKSTQYSDSEKIKTSLVLNDKVSTMKEYWIDANDDFNDSFKWANAQIKELTKIFK